MAVFFSHSPEETFLWAKEYAKSLKAGDVVLLEGEMGAGKTVLAQGIARGLGIEEDCSVPRTPMSTVPGPCFISIATA